MKPVAGVWPVAEGAGGLGRARQSVKGPRADLEGLPTEEGRRRGRGRFAGLAVAARGWTRAVGGSDRRMAGLIGMASIQSDAASVQRTPWQRVWRPYLCVWVLLRGCARMS